uniref:Tripartite motif containing 35 n=1 Tax=Latimeria chalumnae TaxID=7897 RepID=H3A2R6_LATCH
FYWGFQNDITCCVCQKLLKDPLTLRCGHNFCQQYVCEHWKEKTSKFCLSCSADTVTSELITNRTMGNIIEMYKKEGKKSKVQSESICSEHEEKLKLYCLEDQKAICIICQTSRRHENHKFLPIEEAAQEFKEEFNNSLKPFQETHQKIDELIYNYRENLMSIYDEADKTEKQIKEDFVKLHQFLHEEEKNMLADLKKEEEEKEQKMRAIEESIVQDLMSVSKMITDIQQKMDEEDQIFLMELAFRFIRIKIYADYKPKEPEAISAVDIDGYKYTDGLQYRVCKSMLKFINPVMVTLDPNTAHPQLTLSEDQTTVTRGITRRYNLPDNTERFDVWPGVLGSEGFTSGRHSWVVDVEDQTGWDLGVAAESANRKGLLDLRPKCEYWTVVLFCEGYYAINDEGWIHLKMLKTPKKVLVCVDYDAGKVSFSHADDMSHIYTFTHKFKHKIFPFFCPQTVGTSLRICHL